jgi:hypothetical protein
MAARRSEIDVLKVKLELDSDKALADLIAFTKRQISVSANVNLDSSFHSPQLSGIPGIAGLASYAQAVQALTAALSVAQSRRPQTERAQAFQNARTIAASIARDATSTQSATAALASEVVQQQIRGAAQRIQRPYLPRGQFVYAATGKGAGSPTGSMWDYTSTADYNRQKGIVPKEQYMARQAADEQRRYSQQERDETYAAVSRNVDRRKAAAAERKIAADRERNYQTQNRNENTDARATAQARKQQNRDEQYSDVSDIRATRTARRQAEAAYRMQNRDEGIDARLTASDRKTQTSNEDYADKSERIAESKRRKAVQDAADRSQLSDERTTNAGIAARRRTAQATIASQISGRESYVGLRQDMINRPGLGGALARSMEAAQARYTQTGATGGGIGGELFNAKMAMGPGMASVGAVAKPIMSGMGSLMSGITSMSATIGNSMLNIGKSVVSHGVTIARTLMSLPSLAFRSMTMIRHAFWNLTFMGGLAAGGAYAAAKALGPAGKVEQWQNQYGMLIGLQKGFRGPKALAAGKEEAKSRLDWITTEALTMNATIPEATEMGRTMTVHNLWNKRMFKLIADLEIAFPKNSLDEILRPFVYLKNQRYGQFQRFGSNFGMTPLAMKAEGIDMRPVTRPKLRTEAWYASVFEKMAAFQERRFGGMRQFGGDTYERRLSNLSDAWFKLRADIGTSALPAAKDAIDAITKALADIATKFKGADFSVIGGLVTRGITYAGDVITAKDPLKKLGGDLKSLWQGPEGLGAALGQTFANLMGHLPNYMKSTWDRLSEVLKTGADWLTKVFETLPSYWERFSLTLKLSMGDMFKSIGTTLSDMGVIGAMVGPIATGIGNAMTYSGIAQAAGKGRLGAETNRKLANATMYSTGIDAGLAGKRTLMPDLPSNATEREKKQFAIVKSGLVDAIATQDWKTAGGLYSKAMAIQEDVLGRNTFFASGRYGGGAVPMSKPLTEMQEAQQQRSLRNKFLDLAQPEVATNIAKGQYPFPGLPGIGSVAGPAITAADSGMLSSDMSPLSKWGSNFVYNMSGGRERDMGTAGTLGLLGALTSRARSVRMTREQGSLPFAALDRIDRESAAAAGGGDTSATIIQSTGMIQGSVTSGVTALQQMNAVLLSIQELLK